MQEKSNNVRMPSEHTSLLSALKSTSIYYDPGVIASDCAAVIGAPETVVERMNPAARAALYVISLYNLRSVEYLTARAADVFVGDRLLIRGAKGSRSCMIVLPGIHRQFSQIVLSCPGRLVSGINYRQLWANCKRAGIGSLIEGHKNIARTHASRYNVVSILETTDEKLVGDCLRHRSSTSSHYYMPRKDVSHGCS
jgi:hypothetical protein